VREYLQFQATEPPECQWAEGLCIKYHAAAAYHHVMGDEAESPDNLWDDLKAFVGGDASDVTPMAVAGWLRFHVNTHGFSYTPEELDDLIREALGR
jgi:hypothetical protein